MTNKEFDQWLDEFLASYYERRPVNATFAGVHTHDGHLPDYSSAGVADSLEEINDLRSRVDQFDANELSETQQLDRKLAAGALDIQRWELMSGHFHESNPCLYTGEAIFGFISLFLTEFAPLTERVSAAKARLNSVPDFLDTATQNLEQVPKFWAWRARNEIDAARDLFGEDIQLLMEEEDIDDPELLDACSVEFYINSRKIYLLKFRGYAHAEERERADQHRGPTRSKDRMGGRHRRNGTI